MRKKYNNYVALAGAVLAACVLAGCAKTVCLTGPETTAEPQNEVTQESSEVQSTDESKENGSSDAGQGSGMAEAVGDKLAGDMTLVGTRPEVPKYVKKYTKEMYATLLLPAGLTSRTSIAYKDEDKLLGEAVDEKSTDNIYLNEVLPAKMRYNLESMKHFGVKADAAVLWDTFTSVVGSERMTVKK